MSQSNDAMLNQPCHLCDHPNAVGVRFCVACGVGLVVRCACCGTVRPGRQVMCAVCGGLDAESTEPVEATLAPKSVPSKSSTVAATRRMPPPGFQPSEWGGLPVLSLDDAVPFVAAVRAGKNGNGAVPVPPLHVTTLTDAYSPWPAAEAGADIDFGPPSVHLRDMDHPEVWVLPDGEPLPLAPPAPDIATAGWVRSDSFVTPPVGAPEGIDIPLDFAAGPMSTPMSAPDAVRKPVAMTIAMPMAPPVEPEAADLMPQFVDHRDAKAARRAAVRRARLAAQAQGVPLEPMPTDVLVVDRDDATRQRLCLLLDSFGFNVQSSRSTAHAVALLGSRVYLAVFADVDLQDNRPEGGIEVCRLAKEGGPLPDGRRPALIMMSAHPSSAERVRAALAGSEQYLVKPLARGHVARALEACDIPLPTDPRGGINPARDPSTGFA